MHDAGAPTTGPTSKPVGKVGKVLNIRSEFKEFKDPKTGALVRQLTGDGSNNVHPYFTSWATLGDDASRVILISDRCGSYQWYMLEVATGKLVQLTAGQNVHTNMSCVVRDGRVFYFDGPTLHSVNVETLEDRELYHVPAGFEPGLPSCTDDGRYVVFVYRQKFPVSTASGLIYSTLHEEYYQHPQSVVMRVDTAAASAAAVWGEPQLISHTLIHRTQPNLVLFCHEGGSQVVSQRMWIIDMDMKVARKANMLYPQGPNECVVHEYWTRGGEVAFQYSLDRNGVREEYNAFIRPDGSWIRQNLFPGKRPGHIQSNSDNTVVIGDCGYLSQDDQDGGEYLALMKHVNGYVQVKRLAWHGTSWNTQESHPHPRFAADDRWVIYNSDVEKSHNVYMVDTHSV